MKRFILSFVFAFAVAPLCFSYTGADVNDRLGAFADEVNVVLPNAATQQNVYSQAWIGKLFPSAPPHFAVGVEAGVTKFNFTPLKEMAQIFGNSGLPSDMVFPTITANARIGGFALPFDIGFSAMYLDIHNMNSLAEGLGIKFFDIGGDIRYAILKGEGVMPQLSIGFGWYFLGGNFSYDKDGVAAKISYETQTMFLQVQLSKTFLFFTPCIGFRGVFSISQTDWAWSVSPTKMASAPLYFDTNICGGGKKSVPFFNSFMPQIYGGFGMNFVFFALNLSASYEFTHRIWAADLSLRFQM